MEKHLVIPCYNEFDRIPVDRYLEFLSQNIEWTLIFVDDGSQDDTIVKLRNLHRAHPRQVVVLRLEKNSGKAEAVRVGMRFGLEQLDSELIGFADADLAAPLNEVLLLDRALARHADVVGALGIRLSLLGRRIHRKRVRALLGRTFARLASWALRIRIRDTQCGMKLFRNNAALRAALRAPFQSRWVFDVELIKRLLGSHPSNLSSRELLWEQPLDAWEEIPGSRLKPHDFLTVGFDFVRIMLQNEIPPEPENRNDPIIVSIDDRLPARLHQAA
jgi:dolichyl-phosphate beta-glucosyltransferase